MSFSKRTKISLTEKRQRSCFHPQWENIPLVEQKRMPFIEAEQCKYQERCVECGLVRYKNPSNYDRPKKSTGRDLLQ